jgi:dTMP kinase
MTTASPTGLFITFEGGDGSGKTTQAKLLAEWLTQIGHTVIHTREPGGTPVGVNIREIVLHHPGIIVPRAEALLYAADRAQHVATVVAPALERNHIVIQDRYIDSSVAYQGAGRVLDASEIRGLSEWATQGLQPHLTVLLDLKHDVARKRLNAANKKFDRLEAEKADFHERVRQSFLQLAAEETHRFLVIDATFSTQEIATTIKNRVTPLLASLRQPS